ncbi:MAG: peptidoglycan-binding domain-containing protein [Patescibacteria group bacterium]
MKKMFNIFVVMAFLVLPLIQISAQDSSNSGIINSLNSIVPSKTTTNLSNTSSLLKTESVEVKKVLTLDADFKKDTSTIIPTENPKQVIDFKPLTVGSRDKSVEVVQAVLIQEGFLKPSLQTGYYGTLTAQGIRGFQTKLKLPVDGKLNAATYAKFAEAAVTTPKPSTLLKQTGVNSKRNAILAKYPNAGGLKTNKTVPKTSTTKSTGGTTSSTTNTPVVSAISCTPNTDPLTSISTSIHFTADNYYHLYKGDSNGNNLVSIGADTSNNLQSGADHDHIMDWRKAEAYNATLNSNERFYFGVWHDNWIDQGALWQIDSGSKKQFPSSANGWEYTITSVDKPTLPNDVKMTDISTEIKNAVWMPVEERGSNGMAPWDEIATISTKAQWLKVTDIYSDKYVIFRTKGTGSNAILDCIPEEPTLSDVYVISDLAQITHLRKTYTETVSGGGTESAPKVKVEVRFKTDKDTYIIGTPALSLATFQGNGGLGVKLYYNAALSSPRELVFSYTSVAGDGIVKSKYQLSTYETLQFSNPAGSSINTLSANGLLYYPNNIILGITHPTY